MKFVVVYNPNSGGALTKKRLATLFKKSGLEVVGWIPIEDMNRLLPHHTKEHATIAVVGGDGTISAAAGLIAGSRSMLAPLPGGTLNHFTKDLGIDQNIEIAVAGLIKAKERVIDIAEVNGQRFINNSSLGLYPSSLRTRGRLENRIGKWPAALYAACRAMTRLRLFTVTIGKETFHTPFIFVGNNEYELDTIGAPIRTEINKGKLSIFVAKTSTRRNLLKIALLTLVGRTRYADDFDNYMVEEFTIKVRRHHVHVSYDGEVIKLRTPLHYKIHKKELRVLY